MSVRYDSSPTPAETESVSAQVRTMFLKGLIFPAVVLVFFLLAPGWLEHRLHEQVDRALVKNGRSADRAGWSKLDFAEVCGSAKPEHATLRQQLTKNGVCAHFHRLAWGRGLAIVLMVVWLGSSGATLWLNQRAQHSRAALIASYRTAWGICITAAVVQLVLLIPLLGYGIYELTTLAADRYFPQVIGAVVIGGLVAVWLAGKILLKSPPLEFEEPLARVVAPAEAPELWRAVREAAQKLGATPPDNIIIGLQMNFYVTELSVRVDDRMAHGRTLFLSYPLLKLLSPAEALAIVGHELGHYLGDDTRLTREFYPLRLKVNGTLHALAHAGWAGWTSIHGIGFFNWAFGGTEQAMSRERELVADRIAAQLTSPATMAQALVKFQVLCEAFNRQLAAGQAGGNPLTTSLAPVIREQLVPNRQFWRDLFEMKTPHPLDSHPDLRTRLQSLQTEMDEAKAIAIATAEVGSAYEAWLGGHEAVLADFVAKADAAISEAQRQQHVRAATYETAEGRQVLEELFPERRIPIRRSNGKIMVGATVAIAAGLAWATSFLDGDAGRIVPVLILGGGAFLAWWLWRWATETEIILRADSIMSTGWNRPLPWSDVATVSWMSLNGSLHVTFQLTQKAPPFSRRAVIRTQRKAVQLSLQYYAIKQEELQQLILKYYTRQIETAGREGQ